MFRLEAGGCQFRIKRVGLHRAPNDNVIEVMERIARFFSRERRRLARIVRPLVGRNVRVLEISRRAAAKNRRAACAPRIVDLGQSQSNGDGLLRRDNELIMGGRLGPDPVWIDELEPVLDEAIVDPIFDERCRIGHAPEPFQVGFVLGEKKAIGLFAIEPVGADVRMGRVDHRDLFVAARRFLHGRFAIVPTPAPGIPEPEGRQKMQDGRLRAAVGRVHPDQDVARAGLGVFDFDIEKTVVRQNARVPEFVFVLHLGTAPALAYQLLVRKGALRVSIGHPHHAVGGRVVVVPIDLLYVFAVVPLRTRHAEEALFQERVALVPESQSETKPLFVIA